MTVNNSWLSSLPWSMALTTGAIALGCSLSACQQAGAVAPTPVVAVAASGPGMQPIRFFGDDFPEAYTALEEKPIEPAAPTF